MTTDEKAIIELFSDMSMLLAKLDEKVAERKQRYADSPSKYNYYKYKEAIRVRDYWTAELNNANKQSEHEE